MYKKSEHVITGKHYLVFCVTAFVSGIFFKYSYTDKFHAAAKVLAALFICISVFFAAYAAYRRRPYLKKAIILPIVLTLFFILGVIRLDTYEKFYQNKFVPYNDEYATIQGVITSNPTLTESGYYYGFDFNMEQLISKKNPINRCSYGMKLYLRNFQITSVSSLKIGDTISCYAKLNTTTPEVIGKNVYLSATSKTFKKINLPKTATPFLLRIGLFIKKYVSTAINISLADSPDEAAVLSGIITGSKEKFTNELYQSFSNAGISHTVAVSGLHTGIFFSVLSYVFLQIFMNRRCSLIISLTMIFALAAAAGFSASVCRSSIMLTLTVLATIINERYDFATSVFLAAGLILAFSPYSLFTQSFVLSFSATLGILVFYRLFKKSLSIHTPKNPIVNYLTSSIALSLSSSLLTNYFSVLFYNKLSTIQILSNLFAVPLMPFILCSGTVSCILFYACPAICGFAFSVSKIFLKLLLFISRFFGRDRFVYFTSVSYSPYYNAIIYFLFLLFIYMALKLYCDKHAKNDFMIDLEDF